MKTYMGKKQANDTNWVIIDAKDQILGRLATKIAMILMGKNKPTYTPHIDCGDGVIVLNAKQIKVTGKKATEKMYRHYTGYQGGLREYNFERLMEKKPQEIILRAVKRMMPRNKISSKMMTRLKVYPDANHKQTAQKPVEVKL